MKSMILSFALLSGFASSVIAGEVSNVAAVSSNTVVWPDYKKDFKFFENQPAVVRVRSSAVNKYVQFAEMTVAVGTSTIFLDDLRNPLVAVMEHDILGNKAVARTLMNRSQSGWVMADFQLLVNGQWLSSKLGKGAEIHVVDVATLLREGRVDAVIVIMEPQNGRTMIEVVLSNKE